MDKLKKDFWDKLLAEGTFIGSILIPLALVFLSNNFSSSQQEKELSAEYVKQAIEILSEKDVERLPEGLRLYAFNIIKSSSPVAIPPELESYLLNEKPIRDRYVTSDSIGGGALLRVSSEVYAGSYVYVDNKMKAVTPATLELDEGKHIVEFRDSTGNVLSVVNVSLGFDAITHLHCLCDSNFPTIRKTNIKIEKQEN